VLDFGFTMTKKENRKLSVGFHASPTLDIHPFHFPSNPSTKLNMYTREESNSSSQPPDIKMQYIRVQLKPKTRCLNLAAEQHLLPPEPVELRSALARAPPVLDAFHSLGQAVLVLARCAAADGDEGFRAVKGGGEALDGPCSRVLSP
jgi:hypothetical protein